MDEAVSSDRISHAYLFAGPRGVGKTSIARILAHRINDLPYKHDSFHLDIIEIDAASNRRIDEIRDLREKVHITPTSAKYKVYIIDEVHMLTKEAFNALLKTLEEPPAHCIFILATTEAHKLPETIVSRTQRFNFKPITKTAAFTRLQKIAKEEKIDVGDDVLELLAEFGEGSLRDIIGLLDQLSTTGKPISLKDARSLLGVPPVSAIDKLLGSIASGDAQAALTVLDSIREATASPLNVAKALSRRLRQKLLENDISGDWLTVLLRELVDVSSSTSPQETLELAVLEAVAHNNHGNKSERNEPPEINTGKTEKTDIKSAPEPTGSRTSRGTSAFTLDRWDELLAKVKSEAPSLYTALRLAEPSLSTDKLNLAFAFPLHQKKTQEARHLKLIGRTIEGMTGDNLEIKCTVDKELSGRRKVHLPADERDTLDISNISNIFGSAEVLES